MGVMKAFINRYRKTVAPIPFNIGVAIVLTCIFSAMGCALINAKKEINRIKDDTVIIGHIYKQFEGQGPIVVAARSKDRAAPVTYYSVLHDSGEYEILVDQGKYYVFAFLDKNSNLIYEQGEPAGQYGAPKYVRAPSVGVVFDINIVIPEQGADIEAPYGTQIAANKPEKLYSRQAGVITDLDDERFSEANGAKGFWEFASFFREFGGNIYFIEPYNPEKTPILFIHGASGTPKGWKYFVNHIDRTRYQPWFFYYPTGIRIDSMAYLLLWKLSNLQAKYQFNQLYITAHSMGGLVARSFVVNYGAQFPYVKLLISLATPWGGVQMAEYGVKQSPVVIPSWIDMQPQGDFIKSLYRKKLPANVSFYMFYGHKGSRNPFKSNNDGTITLSSLLDQRPQSEAEMNFAFNEDHASIIYSEEVLAQYNAILREFEARDRAAAPQYGGFLKVHFSHAYNYKGLKPRRALILQPVDQTDGETVTFLDDVDNGKILGPFPPGQYSASMVTMAARTRQKYLPVSIEKNQTKELKFVFVPDGVIRGCVTAVLNPEDEFVGRPDYRYREADANIRIESIALQGDAVRRIPQPVEGAEDNSFNFLIWREDFCYNTCFGFFGLPAGEYKLMIKAQGYQTLEKKYSITPGKPEYFRVTELTRD